MGQDDGGGGMKVTIEALNSLDLNEIILAGQLRSSTIIPPTWST